MNNIEDNIITEISTENLIKYKVTEDNEVFDLIFDLEAEEVTVGYEVYDLDVYVEAIYEVEGTIKESISQITPKYLNNSYSKENPLISPMQTLPTTGYGTLRNLGTYKKIDMKIGLLIGLLTLIATFATRGDVESAREFARSALTEAVSAGIISSVSETFLSDVYYILYQAMHKTVVGAVKEERKPYTLIQSKRIYGPTKTSYFWSERPY